MQRSDPANSAKQKLFSYLLLSKRLAKNPLFGAISLHGPTGTPIIRVLISVFVYNNDEKQKGEFLIMTHGGKEEEVGFNNRSFPNWDNLYANEPSIGLLPWYNKDLDDDLKEYLSTMNITKGRFLDLGTGPATQAIELSKLGFQVTATDISNNAITRAKRMSKGIEFIVDDILESKLKEDSFDYIFDRGCFHVLEPSSRQRYVNQVGY
jgi:SAM-dependent methyltransferase